jgi:hypothetical protein
MNLYNIYPLIVILLDLFGELYSFLSILHLPQSGWLHGVDRKLGHKVLVVGSCTKCWAIWLSTGDMVFNKLGMRCYFYAGDFHSDALDPLLDTPTKRGRQIPNNWGVLENHWYRDFHQTWLRVF